MWRRTEFWHVVIWGLKKYKCMSWADLTSAWKDIPRDGTALRHAIERHVEAPLTQFFSALTGKSLEREAFSAALSDAAGASPADKEQMRALKRAAHRRLRGIPEN